MNPTTDQSDTGVPAGPLVLGTNGKTSMLDHALARVDVRNRKMEPGRYWKDVLVPTFPRSVKFYGLISKPSFVESGVLSVDHFLGYFATS